MTENTEVHAALEDAELDLVTGGGMGTTSIWKGVKQLVYGTYIMVTDAIGQTNTGQP